MYQYLWVLLMDQFPIISPIFRLRPSHVFPRDTRMDAPRQHLRAGGVANAAASTRGGFDKGCGDGAKMDGV